jgi:putative ABC transport system permease protein
VADARNRGLQEPLWPEAWIPYTVTGSFMRGILVRTTNEPKSMIKAVGHEIWATDPSVAMAQPETLEYFLDLFTFAQPRFGLWLVTIFAAIGLVLVTIGVYSVIAYTTSRRTHEIGIRIALGAARGDVLRMVLRKGLYLLLTGIVIGLSVSFVLSRILVSQLWGVSPYDRLTSIAVAGLLLLVGLIACWIPARRATRVNPSTALRYE